MSKDAKLQRGALIGLLGTLERSEARAFVCVLAVGASRMVSADVSLWPIAEGLVFNGELLLFCIDRLKDEDVVDVINGGIQIEDVQEITGKPDEVIRACARVEEEALHLLTRLRGA